jgi:hypothetical protein
MMMIDGRAVRWLQFNSSRRHDDGIRQETASASPSTRTQISRYVWALIKMSWSRSCCSGQSRRENCEQVYANPNEAKVRVRADLRRF